MNSQTTAQLTKLVGVLREELAARNRDLEIEAALEKVRAKTASMQRSEELVALTTTLSKELKRLSGDIYSCGIALCSHDSPLQDFSLYNGEGLLLNYSMPFSANATHARMYESWKSGAESFAELLEGEVLRAHQADMLALASYRKLTDQLAAAGSALPVSFQAFYTANFNHGYLLLITTKPFREIPMLKRFAKVFDQGYTRFLDLKKAEAQAREAQIEAALERVRSRSMSMQHSHELSEVVEKVFKEDQQLGFEALAVDLMVFTEDNSGYDIWISTPRGTEGPFRTPEKLASNVHHQGTVKAWQNRDSVRVTELTGDLFDSYFSIAMDENAWKKGQSDLFTSNPKTINDETFVKMLSKEDKDAIKSSGRIVHTEVFTRHACIRVASLEKRSEAQIDIQKRFTRVFDQSYTRFLDLQRAEAQAREARIEAALEKVRGSAMAMNSSSDLSTTSSMVFSELRKLDINPIRTGVDLLSTNSRRGLLYVAASASDNHTLALTGSIDMGAHPILAAQYESWLKRENYFPVLSPDELKSYYKEMANQLSLPALPYEQFQHREYGYYLPFSEGLLFAWSENPYSENEFAILNRFKTIIDLTFKRYLDLQKAENQARESRIEASLERVRSRTLAMFRSDELAETAAVLFKQLIDLGIAPNRLYIGIIKDESGDIELWATDEDGSKVNTSFTGNKFRNSSIKKMYDGWKQRAQTITIDMRGEELTSYFEYLKGELQVPFQLGLSQKRRVQSLAYFSKGFIGMASPEPQSDESLHLLERFAGVFNLTYIRFADLQHAEAQAREAKIEVALERVRARALAMQHSDELFEVANTLRTQMGLLGQPELETSAVHLYQEDREDFDSWYAWRPSKSTDEPVSGGATIFPINACDLTREMIALYKSAETTYTIKLETGSKKWQDWSAVLAKAAPEIFENLQALDP